MDPETVDRGYAALQQQSQQTARLIESLAGKLQAAAAAGDQSAREWLIDLKELALSVHQEEAQAAQVMQSVRQLVDNHVQQATGPTGQQYVQQAYGQPQYQAPPPQYQAPQYQAPQYVQQAPPQYAQPVYQQGGGGMLGRFLGSSFGSAIAAGAGFGIGEELIDDIFN
jgi:hypothetical protein